MNKLCLAALMLLAAPAHAMMSGGVSVVFISTGSGAASGDLTGFYPSPTIAAGAVQTAKLAADAVLNTNLLNAAVSTGKLATDAVTGAAVLNATLSTSKLAADAVNSAAIINASVGTIKIATVTADSGKQMISCAGVALWRTGGTCP